MYRAAAAVVSALVLLTSCGSDKAAAPPVASSSRATTTTTSTSIAPSSTTAPTTSTVPKVPAPSPSEAATKFIDAWRQGNQLLADTIAVQAAVDAVFAAGEPGSVESRGCNEPPQPPVLCVYRTDAGELQLRVRPEGEGWIVEQARVTPA